MSSDPSSTSSPSKSQTELTTPKAPVTLPQQASNTSTSLSVETPQATAGQRSQSTPPVFILDRQSITSNPRPTVPLVLINDHQTPSLNQTSRAEFSEHRRGRPAITRNSLRSSSSQSPFRTINPYTRPASVPRTRSQPSSATMSSASTPSNTSTAGAGSGSNPSYQLPYAPFPYPAPANAGQQGGKGNGK
ncbi:hypothetical protein GRF29_69g1170710 [Pseudopithomyces chartarum]|uniref:Uncharacterized protein n=1 Tax=Pseudopithomyces chartarum TaxID=1892770 RepID=A0AAN6LYQ3_9PLEO|nr:hypothetical protein GRF29_69g1170710 [Pseudopithomyces chartarum]